MDSLVGSKQGVPDCLAIHTLAKCTLVDLDNTRQVAMLVAIQVASIHPNKQAAAQAVDMQIVLEFHM